MTQKQKNIEKINEDPDCQHISYFKTGPGENDGVPVEDLLMKLATVDMVLKALSKYSDQIASDGLTQEEHNEPPDSWAISAAFKNINDISHALKCGCWGYETAFLR